MAMPTSCWQICILSLVIQQNKSRLISRQIDDFVKRSEKNIQLGFSSVNFFGLCVRQS